MWRLINYCNITCEISRCRIFVCDGASLWVPIAVRLITNVYNYMIQLTWRFCTGRTLVYLNSALDGIFFICHLSAKA